MIPGSSLAVLTAKTTGNEPTTARSPGTRALATGLTNVNWPLSPPAPWPDNAPYAAAQARRCGSIETDVSKVPFKTG